MVYHENVVEARLSQVSGKMGLTLVVTSTYIGYNIEFLLEDVYIMVCDFLDDVSIHSNNYL